MSVGGGELSTVPLAETCRAAAQVHYQENGSPWNRKANNGPDANVPGWYYNLGITGMRAELVANPLIESVVAAVLGPRAWLGFYSGNVNLPGSVHQPLHYDRPFSWRTREKAEKDGQSWPPPTTTLSCSVALTELSEENGATEIYPGTHHETAVTEWPLGERISKHPELIGRVGGADERGFAGLPGQSLRCCFLIDVSA